VSAALAEGGLRKMVAELDAGSARYALPVGDARLPLDDVIGKRLTLAFSGAIHCVHCARPTRKSFNQGYCYPCFRKLAACDSCIVSPEKCHYHAGTCREPDWGEAHCMIEHIVYLANTSGLKVGITRASQVPTRWIDQGATQALPLFRVASRLDSGLVEVLLATRIADKTAWQTMLKGPSPALDLPAERDRLLADCASEIQALRETRGLDAITLAGDVAPISIDYPVLEYPRKVSSLSFDKQAEVAGTLLGIKGQYLIFDSGVINIRRHAGYQVAVRA
jgi:hypothetical protein